MKKMNKYLKAIDTIGKIQEFEGASYYPLEVPIGFKLKYQKEFGILLELASKSTPKKVKNKRPFLGSDRDKLGNCPVCGMTVHEDSKFCNQCGNSLDWSEDE